jgi:hypothetical protein
MIKFKRGKTKNWRLQTKILADGQPGYDKDKHKIKVGDGQKLWAELPYASGLSAEEILDSEENAKKKYSKDAEDITLFTYGTATPNDKTVGKVYLQYYSTAPEVDHIISYGTDGIWTYQIWNSGLARCWGKLSITAPIKNAFDKKDFLYCDTKVMTSVSYPIPFKKMPTETVTLQSSGNIVWAACNKNNTAKGTGTYSLISPDTQDSAKYVLSISVEGYIDLAEWKKRG